MARAPPLYCSLILIIVGVILAVLAVLPWFLIPNAVEDTVKKETILTGPKDDGFKEFKDQTKNPLIYNCYFWNITNPEGVRQGDKPVLQSVGPYAWKKYTHRINITFEDKNTFSWKEWAEYIYDAELSRPGGDPVTDKINTLNTVWLAGLPLQGLTEQQIAFSIAQSLLSELRQGFNTLAINIYTNAWPKVFSKLFLDYYALNVTHLREDYATGSISPLSPFADLSGTLEEIANDHPQLFDTLFDPSTPYSLLHDNTNSVNLWQYACGLHPLLAGLSTTQRTNLCAWRSVTDGTVDDFKQPTQNGFGGLWATVIGVAQRVDPFLNPPFDNSDFSEVSRVAQALGYVHFTYNSESEIGLLGNRSIIDLSEETKNLLGGVKPELGIFIAQAASNYAYYELQPAYPTPGNMSILLSPQAWSVDQAKWIFDTFGSSYKPDGATAVGAITTGSFLALFTGVLNFMFSDEFPARNFEKIADDWNPAAFPVVFENVANAQAALLPVNGTVLESFGLFSRTDLSFEQVFQLYLFLKYQVVTNLATAQLNKRLNSGLIIESSPQEWMFGRKEGFFSQALGTDYLVSGIWNDYTLELGVQNNKIETYLTGNDDVKNYRKQITYNGNPSLAAYFPNLQPAPVVEGSSLTFIGPYRLISKSGENKAKDVKLYLWVPDVVRELELIYSKEVTLHDITLYRYIANPNYKSVVKSDAYINPYDFVMDNKNKYTYGQWPFYLTFPGFTLVKETNLFNDKVVGVSQDPVNWILTWDIEPITGLAMRASAPLQLSLPVGTQEFRQIFNHFSAGVPDDTPIPAWYIIRTNQITKSQADDWKSAVGGALKLQTGLTAALAVVGGVLVIIGFILLIWRLAAGKSGEMTEFELRN